MKITFDPAKRTRNLRERALDFADAAEVFEGPNDTSQDLRFDYPEDRFVTAGFLRGRMVIVVWTPIAEGRRIISMRKANDREKARYRQQLGEGRRARNSARGV
jgi:uncharacterized DUF497 family protein